jgi:acyl-CoA thioesterase FadM
MTAQVVALPTVGEEHVVMAWPRGGEGRKYHSATALHAADGRLLAQAESTWIAIDPKAVRPVGGTA